MIKRIFTILVALLVFAGGVYVYHMKVLAYALNHTSDKIASAYNSFYPFDWNYRFPLSGVERDSIDDVLRYYSWDKSLRQIYYHHNQAQGQAIQGVDYESFLPLDQDWSRDRQYLYYRGDAVLHYQDTLNFLTGGRYLATSGQIYFRDSQRFYQVTGADLASFKPVTSLNITSSLAYAYDSKHVYLQAQVIPGLSPDSFEILSHYYFRSHDTIFYFDGETFTTIKEADSQSFVAELGNGYDARDNSGHYFHNGQEIPMIQF